VFPIEPLSHSQLGQPQQQLVSSYASAIEIAMNPSGAERSPSRYLSWVPELEGQIMDRATEAAVENWDGEGSLPVSDLTVAAACRLVRLLPVPDARPTVSVDRDGELEFEWYVARDRLLSLSVGPSGTLAFASLNRGDRQTGRFTFGDRLPASLLLAISELTS